MGLVKNRQIAALVVALMAGAHGACDASEASVRARLSTNVFVSAVFSNNTPLRLASRILTNNPPPEATRAPSNWGVFSVGPVPAVTPVNPSPVVFSEARQREILDLLSNVIPDPEFMALPEVRRGEMLARLNEKLVYAPRTISGSPIDDDEMRAYLHAISVEMRAMKMRPVMLLDDASTVATQLAMYISRLTDEAVLTLGPTAASNQVLRAAIEDRLEEQLCGLAKDSNRPEFKRALPAAEFQRVLRELDDCLATNRMFSGLSGLSALLNSGAFAQANEEIRATQAATSRGVTAGTALLIASYHVYMVSNNLITEDEVNGGITHEEYASLIGELTAARKQRDPEVELTEQAKAAREARLAKVVAMGAAAPAVLKRSPSRELVVCSIVCLSTLSAAVLVYVTRRRG